MSWYGPLGQGVVAGLLRILDEPFDAKTTIRTERTIHYHCGSIRPKQEGEELPNGRNFTLDEIDSMLRLKTLQWEANNFFNWNSQLAIPRGYFSAMSRRYPRESPPWPRCSQPAKRPSHRRRHLAKITYKPWYPSANPTVHVMETTSDGEDTIEDLHREKSR